MKNLKYKTPYKKRKYQNEYKLKNWEKVREYQKLYMREWRRHEPGKTIKQESQLRYLKKNQLTMLLYQDLRNLMKKDKVWVGGSQIRVIVQTGELPRKLRTRRYK
jgi:hypothetical protein